MTIVLLTCLLALAVATGANAMVAVASTAVWATHAFRGGGKARLATPPAAIERRTTSIGDQPIVSIHMAIYDEPPEMVIDSLNALSLLDYDRFEVVVIDNNTRNPDIWRPVESHVSKLGAKFRFMHCMGVENAKAGALNIALTVSDSRAEYVAIVDADYQVNPGFLFDALSYLGPDVRFVQFPQAYRRSRGAEFLSSELGDYFRTFPTAANRAGASLLTGTLSVISMKALRGVGGWPTQSITEDAALGLALLRHGSRGRYVDRVVGRGLLPLSLSGLRTQRRRWAAGNMQVLLQMLGPGGMAAGLNVRAAIYAQLTAWAGFMALPLAALAADASVRSLTIPITRVAGELLTFIEAAALIGFIATLSCVALRSLASGRPASVLVSASLLWTSSLGWLPALARRPMKFRRTPKAFVVRRAWWSLDLIGSVLALMTAGAFLRLGSPWIAGVLALSASGLVTAPFVDLALHRAARNGEGPPCRA